MELWDVYDDERNLTDRTMERGTPFTPGDYHLVVHVCIFNKKGEMLIQQRQPFKEGWPNMWDVSVGGSAVKGDNSRRAAEREVLEELGITIDLSSIRPSFSINYDYGFDDFYLIKREVSLDELHLQYEEVQAAKWATKEEIITMIHNHEFIPYYDSLIGLMFDSRNYYGSHDIRIGE